MRLKMFDGNDLPHGLLLTTKQKTKLKNAFDNMSTNIKLPKAQVFKIIEPGGSLGPLLSKLAGPLMKVAVPLTEKYFSSIRNYSCCFSN